MWGPCHENGGAPTVATSTSPASPAAVAPRPPEAAAETVSGPARRVLLGALWGVAQGPAMAPRGPTRAPADAAGPRWRANVVGVVDEGSETQEPSAAPTAALALEHGLLVVVDGGCARREAATGGPRRPEPGAAEVEVPPWRLARPPRVGPAVRRPQGVVVPSGSRVVSPRVRRRLGRPPVVHGLRLRPRVARGPPVPLLRVPALAPRQLMAAGGGPRPPGRVCLPVLGAVVADSRRRTPVPCAEDLQGTGKCLWGSEPADPCAEGDPRSLVRHPWVGPWIPAAFGVT